MYTKFRSKPSTSNIKRNTSYIGETIEAKIRRILNNKEPITDTAPLVYTERKDGVKPEYDIRTDRFEIAVDAQDYIDRANKAKREERHMNPEQKAEKQRLEALKAADNNREKFLNEQKLKDWGTQDNTSDSPK